MIKKTKFVMDVLMKNDNKIDVKLMILMTNKIDLMLILLSFLIRVKLISNDNYDCTCVLITVLTWNIVNVMPIILKPSWKKYDVVFAISIRLAYLHIREKWIKLIIKRCAKVLYKFQRIKNKTLINLERRLIIK